MNLKLAWDKTFNNVGTSIYSGNACGDKYLALNLISSARMKESETQKEILTFKQLDWELRKKGKPVNGFLSDIHF